MVIKNRKNLSLKWCVIKQKKLDNICRVKCVCKIHINFWKIQYSKLEILFEIFYNEYRLFHLAIWKENLICAPGYNFPRALPCLFHLQKVTLEFYGKYSCIISVHTILILYLKHYLCPQQRMKSSTFLIRSPEPLYVNVAALQTATPSANLNPPGSLFDEESKFWFYCYLEKKSKMEWI